MHIARRTPFVGRPVLARFDGTEDIKSFMAEVRTLLQNPTKEGVAALNDRVLADNFKQREELRERDTTIADLKKKVPAEGSVVLTADEAKVLEAYKALGKPEEIKTSLAERDTLKQNAALSEHEKSIDAAAEALGYEPKVMKQLKGIDSMKIEVVEEKVDGEMAKVVYVTGAEQGATRKKLDEEHVEATWPGILPALQATDAVTNQPSKGSSQTFPKQQPSAPPKKGAPGADEFRKATESTASYQL